MIGLRQIRSFLSNDAPNPVGQAILGKEFGEGGVSPLGLFLATIVRTLIVGACFMLLR
jgi:hypothetical protein